MSCWGRRTTSTRPGTRCMSATARRRRSGRWPTWRCSRSSAYGDPGRPDPEMTERIAELRRRGIAVVLVDRMSNGNDSCSVGVDDLEGGRLAVQHLVDQGHRSSPSSAGRAACTRSGTVEWVLSWPPPGPVTRSCCWPSHPVARRRVRHPGGLRARGAAGRRAADGGVRCERPGGDRDAAGVRHRRRGRAGRHRDHRLRRHRLRGRRGGTALLDPATTGRARPPGRRAAAGRDRGRRWRRVAPARAGPLHSRAGGPPLHVPP